MRPDPRLLCVVLPTALVASTSGYAVTYLTVEQAQASLWAGATLTKQTIKLTPDQRRAIEKAAGVRVRVAEFPAWRTADGGWFLVDNVIGKHEYITYALAITPEGTVAGLEILDYRETYGGEIQNAQWRRQFTGQSVTAQLKLDVDIKNISGATLSCRSITDGVKRLLATHALALRARP